jgi:antitoxin ParD1/3/4
MLGYGAQRPRLTQPTYRLGKLNNASQQVAVVAICHDDVRPLRRNAVTASSFFRSMIFCFNSMIAGAILGDTMGTTRKTITVTDQQDEWIKAQIEAGGFTNDSEYIRELIRRDQARNAEIGEIRAELIRGEESGEPQPFDAARFKGNMTAKHAKKSALNID